MRQNIINRKAEEAVEDGQQREDREREGWEVMDTHETTIHTLSGKNQQTDWKCY